ncbi:uncharacterized protein LOC123554339 [Mercenaria mercenaria]|uniref:uncharacterized protein LOC123554339 n=1 Tax=Mercenaria mercenaria TaxID=6596 RepID=UPI00234EBB07|nr:uncharacterized protein LOC123554339 [Mercenaria mercenaria]
MGVDIETYRGRIGTFKFASGVDVIILQCTLNFSGCLKAVGSLVFIGILLFMAGIEQNPGPTEQGNSSAENNSMVSYSRKDLNQPPYKNWVRAATGFRYLKSGLQTFISRQLQEQHSNILRKIGPAAVRCTSCTTDNLLPDHPSRTCRCLQKFRNKCFCKDHHSRRKCPNNFCSKFYDEIIFSHAEANPLWFNVDTTRWYDNFFEFAKCFVSTTGYREQHSVTEMDALGLLSIAINDLHIHDAIDKLDLFETARESRHEIFHTKSYEVTDDQLNTYIEEMIDVLQDTKCLASYPDAQQAVEELKRLKANQIYISEEDASAVMDIALEAIRESKHEAISDIENARASAIHDIDSRQDGKQIDDETRLTKRQELQAHIIEHYGRYYSTIDVSPLVRSKEIAIDELYTPLVILNENQKRHFKEIEHLYMRSTFFLEEDKYVDRFIRGISGYQCEAFFNNGNMLRNVFLTGEAGFGKTTLCKKLLSVWCNMHKSEEPSKPAQISIGQNWNLDFFQFVFYICLRDTNKESSLEEMVKRQLLHPKYHDTFEEILKHEPEKCLFICDGLDEWNPPEDMPKDPTTSLRLPLRNSKSNYVTLFTARSWKLDNIRPKSGEVDAMLDIKRIVSCRELIAKLLRLLNKTSNKQVTIDAFLDDVRKREKLQSLMKTPLVLKLIVCLWYEKQMLNESLICVYSDIIELFLHHATVRNNRDHDFKNDARHTYTCKADICPFIAKDRPYIRENSYL